MGETGCMFEMWGSKLRGGEEVRGDSEVGSVLG